jgi:Tetracyclin repressor-like, C-terminal domain
MIRSGRDVRRGAQRKHRNCGDRQGLYAPLMELLGSDQPELRAALAISQVIGVGMGRYVLKFDGLAEARSEDVIDWLGPVLQRYLTGKLD